MATIFSVIGLLRAGARVTEVTVDKYAHVIEDFYHRTATERSDNETRIAAKPRIVELFQADPEADFDPREVVQRVGLKNCQADRVFARYQIKQARLTYQAQRDTAA